METKNNRIFVSMETKSNHLADKEEYSSVIIGKLMNIGGILQREGNKLLMPYQLNQQQFSILFEIQRAGEVQQKNMVNRLLLEKAHVSKVVKKLHMMGLIEEKPSPGDKRTAYLSVTDKGKQVVVECRDLFGRWKSEQFGNLSQEELQVILHSVDKLQKALHGK